MATQVIRYALSDFNQLKIDGFSFVLGPDTLKIIQALAEQVGAPEYIKTPQFEKREPVAVKKAPPLQLRIPETGSRSKSARPGASDADWETLRRYQATVLLKKQGIEASIDQIRKHLNKMTSNTYSVLKPKVIAEIDLIIAATPPASAIACACASAQASSAIASSAIASPCTTDGCQCKIEGVADVDVEQQQFLQTQLQKIGEALFSIASGNSFYSEMYVTLYKELMDKYSFMHAIFETNFDAVNSLFSDFTYCDPNINYDLFCNINKANEKRRALSLFYVNLMKQRIISPDKILPIITDLQTLLLKNGGEPDRKNIVDELSEVLYLFIVQGAPQLKTHEDWSAVLRGVTRIAQLKPKVLPSVTNKTIFKHMEMLEALS